MSDIEILLVDDCSKDNSIRIIEQLQNEDPRIKVLKSKKSIIPKIVKNFYDNKKSKGYIPFIANKESNTLFLRKYHQKYNKNILNTESNLKSLPKIYKHIPFNK